MNKTETLDHKNFNSAFREFTISKFSLKFLIEYHETFKVKVSECPRIKPETSNYKYLY